MKVEKLKVEKLKVEVKTHRAAEVEGGRLKTLMSTKNSYLAGAACGFAAGWAGFGGGKESTDLTD